MSSFQEISQLESARQQFFYDIKAKLLARSDTDHYLVVDIRNDLAPSIFDQLIRNRELMEFIVLRVECLKCHNHFTPTNDICQSLRYCEACL